MPNETTRWRDICDKNQLIFCFTPLPSISIAHSIFIDVSLWSVPGVSNSKLFKGHNNKEKKVLAGRSLKQRCATLYGSRATLETKWSLRASKYLNYPFKLTFERKMTFR